MTPNNGPIVQADKSPPPDDPHPILTRKLSALAVADPSLYSLITKGAPV